jgi:UDP-N-acetylmuramoyl-L-alanyl-D-glutamate--2,6-diaminopimelate ligase
MESLLLSDGTTLIIDYAHTPDALENVLRTVRKSVDEGTRLWCVFGCGGDRDRGKRPQMGQVAESLADQVVVTNDNPRTEPVDTIMEDIRRGMHNPDTALWIPNRREAIEKTVQLMGAGDTLVLAGKGHETTQVVGTEKLKFDDREEALRAFADSNLTHETGQRA